MAYVVDGAIALQVQRAETAEAILPYLSSDDYLGLLEAKALVPLPAADGEINRELALRALGRLQPATRGE